MDLEFRDLTYGVCTRFPKSKYKEVLKGVHGKFMPGKLIAIMGPSGAGKSSLLNAVSGYVTAGVKGDLCINGQRRDERRFQRSSCYITQEDLLQPLLTVREIMDVVARLKSPKGVKCCSAQILQELGLLEHQHTKTEQLSGGQKKRLSIALELVNNPPFFFLDEPTSGLDNVTALQCVKLLKELSKQGRTVVCTIHQPTASLMQLFDQMYVIAKGCCVYNGDPAALVPHLEKVGFPCPKHYSPSDYIIELTENLSIINKLCEQVQNGRLYKSAKLDVALEETTHSMELKICYQAEENAPETEVMLTNGKCTTLPPHSNETNSSTMSLSTQLSVLSNSLNWMRMHKKDHSHYATSYYEQFCILLCRMLVQTSRNYQGIGLQIIHYLLCSLLIGLCFLNIANDGTQMFNHLKLCVGIVIFFAYTQIMVPVLVYPQEVKLVKKEHFNCWYSLTPYYAAVTVSKLPLQMSLNLMFCIVVYFMVGVPFAVDRFITFCVIANVISLTAEGLGIAIGAIFSVTNGCAIGPCLIAPFLGLGIYGFDFAHRIPFLMKILMKMSFIRCGIVAMVLTMFGFNRAPLECKEIYCHFAKPEMLIKFLDIEHTSVFLEVLTICSIMVLFRSICYIGLRVRFAT